MPEQKEEISVSNLLQAQRQLLLGPAGPAPAPAPAPGPAVGPAVGGEGEEDTFVNIKHYAYLIYGRKWWVLLVTVVVAGAAAIYASMRPKAYEAQAEVVLNQSLVGTESLFGRRMVYYDPDALAKLAEMDEVAEIAKAKVPEELKRLRDDPGTKLTPGEEGELDEAIALPGGTGPAGPARASKFGVMLTGRYEGTRSEKVAKMIAVARAKARALALIQHFQDSVGGGQRKKMLQDMIENNEGELKRVSEALAEAIKNRKPEENLPPGVISRLDFIQMQKRGLMRADLAITEAEQRIKEIRAFLKKPDEGSLVVSPKMQARLVQLYSELEQMKARYKENHPKLQRKQAEITALKKFLARQKDDPSLSPASHQPGLRLDLRRAEVEKRSLEARKRALSESITAATEQLAGEGSSAAALKYEKLVREQRSLEDMSDHLRRKLREAELAAVTETGESGKEIVKLGKESGADGVGADRGQTIGFAVILGLVMGVLLALLLEHLDDTVRSEISARRAAGLPVIARLPRFEGAQEQCFISPDAPRSAVAETFKFFHNHVRYTGPNAPEKCLQVTSPLPEEGKSYVAVNLALSFASEGNRVCFLDADLRRSRTHERVDILRPLGQMEAGLCSHLEGQLAYEEVLLASENENLSLVLAGGRAANPPRLLRSERMRELLDRLQAEFDVVVIDAPPVLPVVDSAILSSLARATLLVVRFGHTHQGDLAEAASRLAHVNAPLAGVVINGVHGAAGGYYGRYRYHYRYGTGYGGG